MKKLIAHFSLLFFSLGAVNALKAQYCGYIYPKNEEIERYTEGYVRNFETRARPRTVVKIPVVVHVVWRTEAENIPDVIIRGQIDSLTKDFRKKMLTLPIFLPKDLETPPPIAKSNFASLSAIR